MSKRLTNSRTDADGLKIAVIGGMCGNPEPARVGNVYPIRGGRGLKYGHMQVLIAIARAREAWQGDSGLLLVIDKEGAPVGVNSYGMHALEELQPIAFVEGLEEMTLAMRSL